MLNFYYILITLVHMRENTLHHLYVFAFNSCKHLSPVVRHQ